MKFYKLMEEYERKIVGKNYPQISLMSEGYNYNWPDSTRNYIDNGFAPNLDGFQMLNGSKYTNILSEGRMSGRGILCDNFAYSVLGQFTMSEHIVYPAFVYTIKDEKLDFNFIFFPFQHFKERKDLLISNSKFKVLDQQSNQETVIKVKINNVKELHDICMRTENDIFTIVSAQRLLPISLKIKKDKAFDIFDIPVLDLKGRYCNELVKEKIEQEGITGIRFEEVPWLTYE